MVCVQRVKRLRVTGIANGLSVPYNLRYAIFVKCLERYMQNLTVFTLDFSKSSLVGRALDKLSDALNVFGTSLIGALTLLVCSDVAARNFLGQPIKGVPEMAAISIVAIVYSQIASALRAGRWTMSDLLLEKMSPRTRHFTECFFHLSGGLLFLLMCVAIAPYVREAYTSDDYVGIQGLFTFPTWPVKAIILTGTVVCTAQFFRISALHATQALKGEDL
jgi:TRAP-type C4-dicarboxylate transport system permease small subunit